jgi:hypothetical protein
MATVDITVNNSAWTEVVAASGKGLFSNNAPGLFVRTGLSLPSPSVNTGHPIDEGESINVDLSTGSDAMYARVRNAQIQASGTTSFTAS